ncbi:META domain-containing protein [Nitrobacter sp. NHB1]|uniref:META domain-containing protein n=1 Tax=Nitrobacter sp. NHB1 TaxID=3119830 RepID=UPI002FFF2EF2
MATRFGFWFGAVAVVVVVEGIGGLPASAQDGFPFGLEMTLDAPPQPGSKRVPSLEIGDSGEAKLELWCKGGKGQFSVAGNTVIFAAGPLEDRSCPPEKAQADDDLVAALSAATTWERQGDAVSFAGPTTLRFHLNTN